MEGNFKCFFCGSEEAYRVECPKENKKCCIFHYRCPRCKKHEEIEIPIWGRYD